MDTRSLMSDDYKERCCNLCHKIFNRSSLFGDYPQRLSCTLCSDIMIEPTQTQCGCRFCEQCIRKYIDNGETKCPNCEEERIERDKIISDKALEREMMNLSMKCPNGECGDIVVFKYLCDHLDQCLYRREQCCHCKQLYRLTKIEEHINEQCSEVMVTCEDCGREMTREDLRNKHRNYENYAENICEKWIGVCPYDCTEDKMYNIESHMRNCRSKPRKCIFEQFGCQWIGSGNDMDTHCTEDITAHNMLTCTKFEELNNIVQKLTRKIEEIEGTLSCSVPVMETNYYTECVSGDIKIYGNQAIWTIRNIRQKINENIGKIVSESFYINRPGYKMSLKIYPCGDGRAINRYVSVFFQINKGVYDDEIPWPFRCNMTLSILTNGDSKDDIHYCVSPNNNVIQYGRPVGAHNANVGRRKFVLLSDIISKQCYTHNGALKIRLSN